MPPLVSIIMTCYNRERYIGEAIESALNCGYQNFELIVVDDCSSDRSVDIVRSYVKKNSNIQLYINEKNLGDYPNRNKASGYAKGKYLVNADSDDTIFEGVLYKWVEEMENNNALFGIFSKMEGEKPVLKEPATVIRMHFFEKAVLLFGPGATIINREFFYKMNGFPEKYGPANDMYHHIKLAAATPTLFFPYPLINYRIHEGQEINNAYGYLFNNYNCQKDVLNEIPLTLSKEEINRLSQKNKRRFIINVIEYLFKTRDFAKAKLALEKANFSFSDFIVGLIHF